MLSPFIDHMETNFLMSFYFKKKICVPVNCRFFVMVNYPSLV